MLSSFKDVKDDPLPATIPYRQLLRQAYISRNTMVRHGGATPIGLAFGRGPADITAIENMTPAQLTTEAPAPERQIGICLGGLQGSGPRFYFTTLMVPDHPILIPRQPLTTTPTTTLHRAFHSRIAHAKSNQQMEQI